MVYLGTLGPRDHEEINDDRRRRNGRSPRWSGLDRIDHTAELNLFTVDTTVNR